MPVDSSRFYVYMHRFANGTLYVGKGCSNRAWQLSSGRHNKYWDRLLAKYGNPVVRIVSRNLDEIHALAIEVEVIAKLHAKGKSLCNRTAGGNGCVGLLVSDETRKKISDANRGEKNKMHGKKQPQHVKDAISAANTGRFVGRMSPRYIAESETLINDETGETFRGTRQEFSLAHNIPQPRCSMLFTGYSDSVLGWRLSSTAPENTGRRGKRHGRYDHTIYEFIHKNGTRESCTKNELATKYQLTSPSNLSSVCAGKIKSHLGWSLAITD